MTTFLIVLGAALLATGAAMYIDHARRNDPRWIAGAFIFPFVIPLYYRRHWEELFPAAFLQASSLVLLASGVLMMFFASSSPDGVSEQRVGGRLTETTVQSGFVGSERANRLISMRTSKGFSGRINGVPFMPDRVELIDGVLRLTEGASGSFYPTHEVAIDLGANIDTTSTIRRVVTLHTAMPPVLTLSWLAEDGQPQSTLIRQGYWMDLSLTPLAADRLAGHIQLTIPDRHESYAAGDITAVTTHLRYINGEVDRFHDHEDTLAFVAEQFLNEQYSGGGVSEIHFDRLYLDVPRKQGEARATVLLEDGREARHVVRMQKGMTGWMVMVSESLAATRDAGFELPSQVSRTVAASEKVVENVRAPGERSSSLVATQKAEPRIISFSSLSEMSGQGAVIEYRSGRKEEGVLKGIRRDRLILEAIKRGGLVEYQVAEQDIAVVRLSSGEVLAFSGPLSDESTKAGVPVSTIGSGDAGAVPSGGSVTVVAPVVVAGVDVTPFLNRNVRVVADDGKVTIGILRGVNSRNRVVVETLVGGGRVDYTVPVDRITAIERASP